MLKLHPCISFSISLVHFNTANTILVFLHFMYCNKKGYFGDTLKQRFLLGEETEAQKDKVNLSKVTNNHRA